MIRLLLPLANGFAMTNQNLNNLNDLNGSKKPRAPARKKNLNTLNGSNNQPIPNPS